MEDALTSNALGSQRGPRVVRWTAVGVSGLSLAAVLAATSVFAANDSRASASETLFLLQIVLFVLFGRLIGEGLQRLGQPSVLGALVTGLVLGPSVLGAFWPAAEHWLFPPVAEQKAMLNGLAQFGVLLLLLLAGMETDLGLVSRVRRAAFCVSVTGIALPFACGFALGQFLPDTLLPRPDQRLVASLFLGTALSISSVKIVAMVIREMNFVRRNIGQVILASAVIDDTLAWLLIAIIFGIAGAHSLDIKSFAVTLAEIAVFLALSFTVGRSIVFHIIRWTNDNFISEVPIVTAVLLIMGGMAMITDWIGVQDVLGAFVAGILVGDSPIRSRQLNEQLRGLTTALFLPIFFGLSGLGADLTILKNPMMLALTAGLIVVACFGKFAGAFLGASIGGFDRRNAVAIGFGMNARGSTEVIVATIGLSMGALSQNLFTMILTMAVLTTFAMPPTLRWALKRLPVDEEEKKRLSREAFELTAFVPRLERILVVADEGATGQFASRLAGLLASSKGVPVTALAVRKPIEDRPATPTPELVAASAEQGRKSAAKTVDEAQPRSVAVITVEVEALDEAAVAKEATNGYDLMMVGLNKILAPESGFDETTTSVIRGFSGSLALSSARGIHVADPQQGRLDILVPVDGTAASRGATEVAFVLARATKTSVHALYVSNQRERTWGSRHVALREEEKSVLRDLDEIAGHYGVDLSIVVQTQTSPEDAILEQAHLRDHSLVVMSANRRAGDVLSFGDTARNVIERLDRSLLLVSVDAAPAVGS